MQQVIEMYTVYLDDTPRALTMAQSTEQAVSMFRQANLGTKLEGKPRAERSAVTPFETFVRLALEGLYMTMFQAGMARQMGRH